MEPQIPKHLLPTKAKEDIKTSVVNETSSDNSPVKYEDIARIGKDLGVITLSENMMESLRGVGADLQTSGVVTVANGLAYVSAGAMTQVMLKLVQDALSATKSSEREKIARTLAYLAGSIDKQNRTLKMDHVGQNGSGNGAPPVRKTSFEPHQHVHFHQHGVPTPAK